MNLRERAVELRRAAPLTTTRRPRAKDEARNRARLLRLQGKTYQVIAAELSVSTSSVSLWVRDLPRPSYDYSSRPQCTPEALARLSAARRQQTEISRRQQKAGAEAEIGELSDRELLLVGAAIYWAEGAKDKPWSRSERVSFVNSDPDMIRLFLQWLDIVGVAKEDLTFRLTIHESADIAGALGFWGKVVGLHPSRFLKTTLKRTKPNPKRRNLGDQYHGCLVVRVRRSTVLYRRIDGWWRGIVHGSSPVATRVGLDGRSGLD